MYLCVFRYTLHLDRERVTFARSSLLHGVSFARGNTFARQDTFAWRLFCTRGHLCTASLLNDETFLRHYISFGRYLYE